MKNFILSARSTFCFTAAAALLYAAQAQTGSEQRFASPEEAATALRTAAERDDHAELKKIFGPEVKLLVTGDAQQDHHNFERFRRELAQKCVPVADGDNKMSLQIGTNDWPFPIPLVKEGSQWYFDTAAGKEEIVNRHVGKDELHAIGVCKQFVAWEKQHGPPYSMDYKEQFGSYTADAGTRGSGQPYHGYLLRILTCQGNYATGGKMSYFEHGKLTKGFALVAYPEHFDQSGVMTFIVNQDGTVYESCLGPDTRTIASRMKAFDPDSNWKPVQEQGISAK